MVFCRIWLTIGNSGDIMVACCQSEPFLDKNYAETIPFQSNE